MKAFKSKQLRRASLISSICIGALTLGLIESYKESYHASPGNIQFQWDPDPSFKRLKSYQTSNKRMNRAFYYFFLRSRARKTAILKLTIKVPDYFKAKILPGKLSLCEVKVGSFTEKTKCLKNIPALFEIGEEQKEIMVA